MKFQLSKLSSLAIGGAVVLLVLVVGAIVLSKHSPMTALVPSSHMASTTLAASAGATTTNATPSTAPKKAPVKKLSSSTPVAPTVSATTTDARELDAAGGKLLDSLVNIVCLSSVSYIPSISGSGVIIDSRGIILTAAHVAQLFALQDYLGTDKVACLVRTGSPARRAYLAEPIYISKSWINNNPSTLDSTAPLGTGQYDVALLGITGTATSTPLPSSFPAIPLASGDPVVGEQTAIGSYGAQYLSDTELNYSLYPILVFGPIEDRYTFGGNTLDLVSVSGSAASQEGSSGGGVVNDQGQLIGTITTSSVSGSFSTRELNADTVLHLRNTFLLDTGENLDTTLQSESVPQLIANFAVESKLIGAQLVQTLAQ